MSNPISDPLWSLMLATNDCHPGCGCEQDRFDRTPERVAVWSATAKSDEPAAALDQIRTRIEGIAAGEISRRDLSMQTSIHFRDDATAIDWLRTWERLLEGVLHSGPDAVEQARRRADLAERFARKEKRG